MDTNSDLDKLQLLKENYRYLFSLYRLGRFEARIDSNRFKRYGPEIGNWQRASLQSGAEDLYLLARTIEDQIVSRTTNLTGLLYEEAIELILRTKVLTYEIDDYFLTIPPAKSEEFIRLSREIIQGPEKYVVARYHWNTKQKIKRKITQYLLLIAICGVNESYRQHNKEAYEDGLKRGEKILDYIRHDLPRMQYPSRSGQGLIGLCCYVLGRLNFVLGSYHKADSYFRDSLEAYSERIQIHPNDSSESLLVTLRRSALVAAFGCAYSALIDGRVREAITVSALARGIIKQNCGAVHAGYVDLIYWAAKRAEASSDKEALINIRQGLRKCRRIFRQNVPGTHYVHRAGVQLGIAYHYLATAYPRQRRRYYQLATLYLTQAVTFAESEVAKRNRNQRLLAEALVILSHVTSNSGVDKFGTDLEQATRALEAAFGIPQYQCESYLAQAAIYCRKARESTSDQEMVKNVKKGRQCATQALVLNASGSARIRATGYLRMAALSFLQPITLPEAHYYYDKWLAVRDSVQHDFLHQWARRIHEEMLEQAEHLFVDVRISSEVSFWHRKVEEYLMNAAIREVAKQSMLGGAAPIKKKRSASTKVRDVLMTRFGISKSDAYVKIKEYGLLEKFQEYSL